jgi:hypothetical protein
VEAGCYEFAEVQCEHKRRYNKVDKEGLEICQDINTPVDIAAS